jgi:energy-coupling factor transport system substrate-specific component
MNNSLDSAVTKPEIARNNSKQIGEHENRSWGIKEVITTILFSVLIIVLMFMASGLTMLNVDFGLIFSTAIACFIAGPVFVLMTLRVRKFGSTIFLAVVTALVFCLAGNYWYMIPFYLALGVLVDLVMMRPKD